MDAPTGTLLVHHHWYTSFSVVARLVGSYLERYYSEVRYDTGLPASRGTAPPPEAVLYVHDSIEMLLSPEEYALQGSVATAAWSDTCMDVELYSGLRPIPASHVVASEANLRMLRPYGVVAALPRVFNAETAGRVLAEKPDKEDYFAAIGYGDETDRKNFRQLRQVVERLGIRVKAVTNAEGPWERIDYASLDEEEKYRLLARARFLIFLSAAEGFGMPPLEAMSVGTPVIFSDVAAHNSFCVGLAVQTAGPPERVSMTQPNGRPFLGTFQWCDLEHAVHQVESSLQMGESDYAELCRQALEAAQRFHPARVVEAFYRTYLRPAGG